MKKLAKMAYAVFLLAIVIIVIYFDKVKGFMNSLAASDDGVLVGLARYIGSFFVDADNWNKIFIALFISFFLILFVIVNNGLNSLALVIAQKIAKKRKELGGKLEAIFKHWAFGLFVVKTISILSIVVLFVLFCNAFVIYYSNARSTGVAEEISDKKPVLVLGTSKMLRSGAGVNLYYSYRINAAKALWEAEKVNFFIVSGDRAGDHYDETLDIKNDLMAFGVPEEMIKLDTAGFRTLDSMLRIRGMFRVKDPVIISQKFHVQRAIVLGTFYGMKPTGFYAQGTSTYAMLIREIFGKCKVVMDLVLFNMQPKVSLNDPDKMQYREQFDAYKSDAHIILLLAVSITSLASLALVHRFTL